MRLATDTPAPRPAGYPRFTPRFAPVSHPAAALNPQTMLLPTALRERVAHRIEGLDALHWCSRLWRRDAALWTGADENRWLGWIDPARQAEAMRRYLGPCARLRAEGWTDAVLLGMGGASLGAHVLGRMLGPAPDGLRLHVLDSTNAGQVRALQARVPVERSLYIVASKSGTTLESLLLARHFHAQAAALEGEERAGRRFCAITDPRTPLHERAEAQGYAAVFFGDPSIGGRYSVLSPFGMVPLALMGFDPIAFLHEADAMRRHCGPQTAGRANMGLRLGALLGEAARMGRDKVTFLPSGGLEPLAQWLEQLLAESTGKDGRGLVPVLGEPLGRPEYYGPDRLFVFLRGPDALPGDDEAWVAEALARAGHPVLRIEVASPQGVAQEFYRWQYATSVAGHVLGVHPFDQPDVEASKARTRALLAQRPDAAARPSSPAAAWRSGSLLVEAGARDAGDGRAGLEAALARWLRCPPGGYHALLAYLPRDPRTEAWLCRWQRALRDAGGGAVTAAFGPRYLHSCGQLHKGGPAGGAYLYIRMADEAAAGDDSCEALAACHAAQAEADMQELCARGRCCLSVRFTAGLERGLEDLSRLLTEALAASPVARGAASDRAHAVHPATQTGVSNAALAAEPGDQSAISAASGTWSDSRDQMREA